MFEEAFNKSARNFSLKLFKNIYPRLKSEKNYVYSSLAIQSCLTMIYIAATEVTEEEIRNALEYDESLFAKVDLASLIKTLMEEAMDNTWIEKSNALFMNPSYKTSSLYSSIIKNYFYSSIEIFDPNEDDKKNLEIFNSWVQKATKDKIRSIVNLNQLNLIKELVFLDVIYFKGEWALAFDKALTKPRQFMIKENESVTVDTMEMINLFNFARFDEYEASVLEMNFAENELSLLIFLFDKSDGTELLEEQSNKIDMLDIIARLYLKIVHIYVPKFEIEHCLELKEIFRDLGIKSMFQPGANFKGLIEKKSGEAMSIDNIIHKSKMVINEDGAEHLDHDFKKEDVQETFNVNKPFYFFLKHKWEHTVIFSGCIRNF